MHWHHRPGELFSIAMMLNKEAFEEALDIAEKLPVLEVRTAALKFFTFAMTSTC